MGANGHLGCEQIAALAFGHAIHESERTRLREHVSACDVCGKRYEAVMIVINQERTFGASANAENWDWEGMWRKIVADTKLPDDAGP